MLPYPQTTRFENATVVYRIIIRSIFLLYLCIDVILSALNTELSIGFIATDVKTPKHELPIFPKQFEMERDLIGAKKDFENRSETAS